MINKYGFFAFCTLFSWSIFSSDKIYLGVQNIKKRVDELIERVNLIQKELVFHTEKIDKEVHLSNEVLQRLQEKAIPTLSIELVESVEAKYMMHFKKKILEVYEELIGSAELFSKEITEENYTAALELKIKYDSIVSLIKNEAEEFDQHIVEYKELRIRQYDLKKESLVEKVETFQRQEVEMRQLLSDIKMTLSRMKQEEPSFDDLKPLYTLCDDLLLVEKKYLAELDHLNFYKRVHRDHTVQFNFLAGDLENRREYIIGLREEVSKYQREKEALQEDMDSLLQPHIDIEKLTGLKKDFAIYSASVFGLLNENKNFFEKLDQVIKKSRL